MAEDELTQDFTSDEIFSCIRCGNNFKGSLTQKRNVNWDLPFFKDIEDDEYFCIDFHACSHRHQWQIWKAGRRSLKKMLAEQIALQTAASQELEEKIRVCRTELVRLELLKSHPNSVIATINKDLEFLENNMPEPLCEGEEL